jgi:hypothetical protein
MMIGWKAKISNLLYTNTSHLSLPQMLPIMLDKVQPRVTHLMNEKLLAPFTPEEFKKAAFSIGDFKAPGPDGLHVVFYKKFWNICGDEITQEVLNAMNSGLIPDGWNDT